jgi:uncharacterized protein (TIGR02996 family)
MTPDDAFLADIVANPDDDAPRLVYADWLDDHGQPDRAAFVRVQIELARLRPDTRREDLEARERELLERHEGEWVGRIRDWVAGWSFRRGMLSIKIKALPLLAISAKAGEDDWFRRGMVLAMHVLDAAPHIDRLAQSPHLARLSSLSLAGNGIGDVHVKALAASPHLARLTALDLSHNFIGGGGVLALSTSSQLADLTTLDLSYNDVDDADVLTLAGSLGLPNLRVLDVSNNPIIFPEDVAELLTSPCLPRLASLKLQGAIYSDEARLTLKARFGDRVRF